MGSWGWLQAIVQGLLSGLNNWLSGRQARQDAVSLGKKEQAAADADAQTALATQDAQKQAQADDASTAVLVGAVDHPDSLRDPSPDSRD